MFTDSFTFFLGPKPHQILHSQAPWLCRSFDTEIRRGMARYRKPHLQASVVAQSKWPDHVYHWWWVPHWKWGKLFIERKDVQVTFFLLIGPFRSNLSLSALLEDVVTVILPSRTYSWIICWFWNNIAQTSSPNLKSVDYMFSVLISTIKVLTRC